MPMPPPVPNPVKDQVAGESCGNETHDAQQRQGRIESDGDESKVIHHGRLGLRRSGVNGFGACAGGRFVGLLDVGEDGLLGFKT